MRYSRLLLCRVLLLLTLVIFRGMPAFAQDPAAIAMGMNPQATYHGGDFDSVDMASGRLNLNIPLVVDHSQRGELNFNYSVIYTSTGTWNKVLINLNTGNIQPPKYGVSSPAFITKGWLWSAFTHTVTNPNSGYRDVAAWVPEDGANNGMMHPLSFYAYSPGGQQVNRETLDGSGISVGSFLANKEGIQFYAPTSGPYQMIAEDTNGNEMGINGSVTTDTMGRAWTTKTGLSDVTGCPTGGPVAPTSSMTWTIPGPANINGGVRNFKFCYSAYNVQTNLTQTGYTLGQYKANLDLMTGVVLPDGTTWRFDYDNNSYADLIAVYPPTGGYVSYTWSTMPDMGMCFNNDMGVGLRTVASRTVNDGSKSFQWTYKFGSSIVPTVTDPLDNDTVYTGDGCSESIYKIQDYSGPAATGTLLKTVNNTYFVLPNPYLDDQGIGGATPRLLDGTTTVWPNGQQSQVKMTYDSGFWIHDNNPDAIPPVNYTSSYGLVTSESHSDYGSGAPGPVLSATNTIPVALSNASNASSYVSANLLDLPYSVVVTDGSVTPNICAETDYGYDEYALDPSSVTEQHVAAPNSVQGNLTSITRQLFTNPCASPTPSKMPLKATYHVFDTGMRHTSTDPLINLTTYAYSSNFYGAFLTQTTFPPASSPNYATHIISGSYDFNTGLLTSFTDQNSNTTNYTYDVMFRPTNMTYPSPDGGQTNFYYANPTTVEMQKLIAGTTWTDSFTYYNGLGREIRSTSKNDETLPWDQIDTCYDANGRVGFKTYPYQGDGGPPTAPFCSNPGDTFAYDPLNRATQVTHSDNSTVLNSYIGRATSGQDEGNGTGRVQRISQVDGLGRLASLCEVTSTTLTVGIAGSTTPAVCNQDISGTGFLTAYSYDALSNLISVAQGPLSPRTFAYDSLSRLLCAENPEIQNAACPNPDTGSYTPGTIRYGYDSNSNLTSKIAPMPNQTTISSTKTVTTTMAYDALNRMLTKIYTNNDQTTNTTPSVTFNYDQTSALGLSLLNTDGRSSSFVVAGSQASEIFSYDKLGRVKINSQCTPQNCGTPALFPITYTYDLLGDTLTTANGEGVTLTYPPYNRALRIMGLTSSLSDSNHPGTLYSAPHYNAAGSVLTASIGNAGSSVSETRGYDARLRLSSITDGSLYTVTIPTSGGYAPDSDILLANDGVNGNWTYGYDAFNRLTSASKTGQSYTYAYDRFGNRWAVNGSGPGFDANNHIVGLGVTYDAAGNELNDGTTAYTYDSENRIISAVNSTSGTSSYLYDADGRRIRKTTVAGGTVDFLYDLGGHEIAQVTSAGAWTRGEIYAGGRHLGTYSGGTSGNTYFTFSDWLGTERVRSTSTGGPYETCTSLPFGDWLTCTGGDPSPMHLTGKEHDNETGLDNFGARYDSSQYARFMTPDWSAKPQGVPYAVLDNPQSLNLYSYVLNNPLTRVDADGHEVDFDKDAKKGVKIELRNVSKAERKMFQVTKNAEGKSVLSVKAGAEDNFHGTHTEGYNRLTTAINSDKVETVNVAKTYTDAQGASHDVSRESGGGVTVMYRNGNSTIYVSPSGNPGQLLGTHGQPISDPLNVIMGHETLGHGLENMLGGDTSQHRAIEIENDLRDEQKRPEREQDPQ